MKINSLLQYNIFRRHKEDYLRYFQTRVSQKKLLTFMFGFVIFFIIYNFLIDRSRFVTSWSPDTKIYFSSIKNLVLKYNNSNVMHDKAQGPATCLIIIRTADGAIGNRMFLFASAYGVARLHQCQLYVAPWI